MICSRLAVVPGFSGLLVIGTDKQNTDILELQFISSARSMSSEASVRDTDGVLGVTLSCLGEGLPLSLFGDHLSVLYQRSAHAVAAVSAARRMVTCDEASRIPFSIGIATGRLLAGPMGCAQWKSANVLGVVLFAQRGGLLSWPVRQMWTSWWRRR